MGLPAHFGDIVGLVPDHCNKENITTKQATQVFCFPSVYKSYIYTILYSTKCAIGLCLKSVYNLIKKYFTVKKH